MTLVTREERDAAIERYRLREPIEKAARALGPLSEEKRAELRRICAGSLPRRARSDERASA